MKKYYRIGSCAILITCFSTWSNASYAQELPQIAFTQSTPKGSLLPFEVKLKDVLNNFRKHYKVDILFSDHVVNGHSIYSNAINLKLPLEQNLEAILKPLGLDYQKSNGAYLIKSDASKSKSTQAQPGTDSSESRFSANQVEQTVRGQVIDASGVGLPGVTVMVKGTTVATATDMEGKFELNVPDGNVTLLVSFIGYITQEVAVNNLSTVNVTLKADTEVLDEVVVIGYGTQKKATVTGSVVATEGSEILKTPEPNIANTLVGRLPGLIATTPSGEPGYENTQILIRGRSTFGDNSPLVVIDGVPNRAGGFDHIDANDIESISVLKDASAAIYGSRAANGVILVTTKRGKEGKPSVTYSMNYALRKPTSLPKMLSSADYAVALNEIETSIYGRAPLYTNDQIELFRNGTDPVSYPNVNYLDAIIRDFAPQTQQNLSMRGGSEAVKYFVSAGYQFQDNYYKNSVSNYKQYNLRSNLDIQLNKNLGLFANLSLRQENRNAPHYGSETIWRFLYKGDPRVNYRWPDSGLLSTPYQEDFNPITAVDGSMGYQKNQALNANLDLGFKLDLPSITEGLTLNGGVYVDMSNNFYKHFNKSFNLYRRNNTTGEYAAQPYGPNNATLEENMSQWKAYTANVRLNYDRTFANVHHVSGFVAYEQNETRNDYLYARRQDYVATNIDELFAGSETNQTNDGNAAETGRMNYFGRLDYSFMDKYLFQFNWRYDGSQNFPKDSRFGFFPGVSAGWVLSEENFMKNNVGFLDFLKVRGSWGQMGNDRIAQYQFLNTYTFNNPGLFGGSTPLAQSGLAQLRVANPNVTWEVATTTNLGLEARFLNNSITFELDLFRKNTTNILANGASYVPDYTGIVLPAENIGEARTQGLEAVLGYNKAFGEFNFSASGNMSFARSKIIYFDEPETVLDWQKATGKPIGSNWLLYESVGIFRTQEDLDNNPHLSNAKLGDLIFRDVDGNGTIDGNDQIRPDRTSTPEIIYGINLGLGYKNWDLSMLLQGADNVSQYIFWESGAIGNFTQNYFDNRWTPENINSEGPRIYDREATVTGRKNTYFLKDASYMRLKNIQLAYTLPKSIMSKLPISNLRVFVNASNLLTFTGLTDTDPETPEDGQGYAGRSTPQAKVLNFGLNISF